MFKDQLARSFVKRGQDIRLPTEIWTNILCLATRMQDDDEFADNVQSIISTKPFNLLVGVKCDTTGENEEKQIIKDRLCFVKVCKSWYRIAIRFLWSHLKINISPQVCNLIFIIEQLERSPLLRSFVLRVDIDVAWDEMMSNELDEEESCAIIKEIGSLLSTRFYPLLMQLQCLFSPLVFAKGDIPVHPSVVFLLPGGLLPSTQVETRFGADFSWEGGPHFWRHTQILDVNLDGAQLVTGKGYGRSNAPIIFPRLIGLKLASCEDESIIEYITSTWQAPCLQMMTLHLEYTDAWFSLIEWTKSNLVTLHLFTYILPHHSPIEIPSLKTIVVQQCFTKQPLELMSTPGLETLLFQDDEADSLYLRHRCVFAQLLSKTLRGLQFCSNVTYYRRGNSTKVGNKYDLFMNGGLEIAFQFDPLCNQERSQAVKHGWLIGEV
jgi:hypothetical protein